MNWFGRVARLLCAASLVLAATQALAAQSDTQLTPPNDLKSAKDVATTLWSNCLHLGRQVVLSPTQWTCTDLSDGTKALGDLDAAQFDHVTACKEDDLRRLPTGVIQALAEMVENNIKKPDDFTPTIRKNGIRLIGGAYCQDEVNLTDFEFAYSLVLDRSVFRFGFRASDMIIGGNLSFGGAYIYDNLYINDSKIGGTLFGNDAFIRQTRISNTDIHDYLRFNRSILLDYFNLIHVKLGRGINVSRSNISSLNVRDVQAVERFDLSGSEAACKYSIVKSGLNEVRASDFGFGTTAPSRPSDKPGTHRIWHMDPAHPEMLGVPTIKQLIDKSPACADEVAEFEFFESTARSFCLDKFHWASPIDDTPSTISINRVTISGNMNLNLWPPLVAGTGAEKTAGGDTRNSKHVLELVGMKVGSLFFDFEDNARDYATSIDQLEIARVHRYTGGCQGSPNEAEWQLPDPAHVAEWLKKNKALSLQPFIAFIKAFENAGADTTDLKVAKAQYEFDQSLKDRNASFARSWQDSKLRFLKEDFLHVFIDYPTFAARWILGQIADFGYRPAQVIWTVLGIVAFSWLFFWFGLRVIAFTPEKKAGMRVVGTTFLFDRLLPLYKIRDEHYDVGAFYQRGTGENAKTLHYFGRDFECIPASFWRARIAIVYLDLLKACGFILAAFMVAAINALIAH